MKAVKQILIIFCVALTSYANASTPWQNWQQIGQAELKWGFWKIYDSALFSPTGKYANQPLALIITYNRNIEAMALLDATVEQWQHLGFSQTQISQWLPLMQKAWPDVKKGDKLCFVLSENGQFYYQPSGGAIKLYSEIENKILAQAFIDIWLSPNTSYPDIRKALIGLK